jgi:hypothetical protein
LTVGQALADGAHVATARATDGAGNVGPLSAGRNFTVDTQAPAAPAISSPAPDEALATSTPTITGTAEVNSTVTVVIDGAPSGNTAADGAGNWSYTVPSPLVSGGHTVTARATDAAGNVGPDATPVPFTTP